MITELTREYLVNYANRIIIDRSPVDGKRRAVLFAKGEWRDGLTPILTLCTYDDRKTGTIDFPYRDGVPTIPADLLPVINELAGIVAPMLGKSNMNDTLNINFEVFVSVIRFSLSLSFIVCIGDMQGKPTFLLPKVNEE